jgi:hypothetical protein
MRAPLALALALLVTGLAACGGHSTKRSEGGSAGGCTEPGCSQPASTCQSIRRSYSDTLASARRCDVHGPNECTTRVRSDLLCGCTTFVNGDLYSADDARRDGDRYEMLGCRDDVTCEPCLEPVRGFCNAQGLCVDASDIGGEPGCRVGGVVSASGASGIPQPGGCGDCSCVSGELFCTVIDCPCPKDMAYVIGCAQCGPSDVCEVVDHACRPLCPDGACASGTCVNGVCSVGMCG